MILTQIIINIFLFIMESSLNLSSFIPYSPEHHFPLQNIPFGAFVNPTNNKTHTCTRIGDFVIDLAVLGENGKFNGALFSSLENKNVFDSEFLNGFMGLGKDYWHEARVTL